MRRDLLCALLACLALVCGSPAEVAKASSSQGTHTRRRGAAPGIPASLPRFPCTWTVGCSAPSLAYDHSHMVLRGGGGGRWRGEQQGRSKGHRGFAADANDEMESSGGFLDLGRPKGVNEVLSEYEAGDVELFEAQPRDESHEANDGPGPGGRGGLMFSGSEDDINATFWQDMGNRGEGQDEEGGSAAGGWNAMQTRGPAEARELLGIGRQKREQPAWKVKQERKRAVKLAEEEAAKAHDQTLEPYEGEGKEDEARSDGADGAESKGKSLMDRALASSDEDGSRWGDVGMGEGLEYDDARLSDEGGDIGSGSEDERVRQELARLELEGDGGDGGGEGADKEEMDDGDEGDEAGTQDENESGEQASDAPQTVLDEEFMKSLNYTEEYVSEYDSGADCKEVLTPWWTPGDDDAYTDYAEAGRRVFTKALLDKLCANIDVTVHLDHDHGKTPVDRFWTSPVVYVEGSDVKILEERLPMGFHLQQESDMFYCLTRHRSPSPDKSIIVPASEEEEEEQEDVPMPDALDAVANFTEYRKEAQHRIVFLKGQAQQGDTIACIELGERMLDGNGTRKDPVAGCKWMLDAAAQGHPYAQLIVGRCYHKGIGVPADAKQAVTWYKLSAKDRVDEEPQIEAMHNLGVCYGEGDGVTRDNVLACSWYKKAAALGCMESQFNLAVHYMEGKGVRVHERKAAYWLLQSALQGCDLGAFLLGVKYVTGKGVRKNLEQGMKWLRKASHRGVSNATELLEALKNGSMPDKVASILQEADLRREARERESRGFIREHEEMVQALHQQLEVSSRRAAAQREGIERRRAVGDQVPERLGKRVQEQFAEAQLEALRELSKRGIPAGGMGPTEHEQDSDEDFELT